MANQKNKGQSKRKANRARAPSERRVLNVFEVDVDAKVKHQRTSNLDDIERNRFEIDEVATEDDEEIDSDDAYGEPDEITASTSKTNKNYKSSKQISEDSDDEDEDELQAEGFVDLSEMLDAEPAKTKETKGKEKITYRDLITTHQDSEDEDSFEMSESDDQENEGLSKYVKSLDPANLKARKFLKEQTETYKESEFNLTLPSSSKSDKLSIADLLAPMQDEAGFTALEKKVQQFSGKKKDFAPLAVPLAKRISDRVVRATAYEHAKERISEWQPIVNQNREVRIRPVE